MDLILYFKIMLLIFIAIIFCIGIASLVLWVLKDNERAMVAAIIMAILTIVLMALFHSLIQP